MTSDFTDGAAQFNAADAPFALDTPAGFSTGVTDFLAAFSYDAVVAPEQFLLGLADLAGL